MYSYRLLIVDLFYFKTCQFREAKVIEEKIFCSKVPEVHYSIAACNKPNCSCCQPLHLRLHSEQMKAVQFDVKKRFRFVSGYQAILNCPAVSESIV